MKFKSLQWLYALLVVVLVGCEEPSVAPSPNTPPVSPPTVGTVARYTTIPLPMVDIVNQIIPNMGVFYVTNMGPYVQIQDTKAKRWSVHKYQGGSGPQAWSSYKPNSTVMRFIPVNFYHERKDEFSIYWWMTAAEKEKYGLYTMNTGSPSFEWPVPTEPNGPGYFDRVASSNQGYARLWATRGNEVWVETAVAVPHKFEMIAELPDIEISNPLLAEIPSILFADPDHSTKLWLATKSKLYEISSVGPAPGVDPGIVRSWNFSSVDPLHSINAVIKADGNIVVQFGGEVFRLDDKTFKSIGKPGIVPGPGGSICTNGSTIFASNGMAYRKSTGKWESYIGAGVNLSAADAAKYSELKNYLGGGLPIGVVQGSAVGPVYILTPTHLVQIHPQF